MLTRSIVLFLSFAAASIPAAADSNKQLIEQATSNDAAARSTAVKKLRSQGQPGLDSIFLEFREEIEKFSVEGEVTDEWTRITDVLDSVSMQKDAFSSQLFWLTDLEAAKLESKRSGKPIISLRLLGNLNEEYSCANSRFFRSILYTDPSIAKLLRENFVLHWQSVRPAPRITVDYGDGRKIVRTITGNSIHYLLDSDGSVLDGLPGLYDPKEFAEYLRIWINFYNSSASEFQNRNTFYQIRRQQLISKWKGDLKKLGISPEDLEPVSDATSSDPPSALRAAPVAITKMAVELPSVSLLRDDEVLTLSAKTDTENWKRIGQLRQPFEFSDKTVQFIRRQITGAPSATDRDFARMLLKLKETVAADTARNEYSLHTRIYKMIGEQPQLDSGQFNELVYDRLFLTPSSDEWLGLYFSDIYTGLERNGVSR